jgi:hypothetical protein
MMILDFVYILGSLNSYITEYLANVFTESVVGAGSLTAACIASDDLHSPI